MLGRIFWGVANDPILIGMAQRFQDYIQGLGREVAKCRFLSTCLANPCFCSYGQRVLLTGKIIPILIK